MENRGRRASSKVLGALAVVFLGFILLRGVPRGRPEETGAGRALADPRMTYDPVRAGEPLPVGFHQLLPRDGIRPVYNPRFHRAADARWNDATLIIGVEINGKAKAYPVSFLNRREMVVDELGDVPILVTW